MSNIKSDAPDDFNLRDVVAHGHAAPSQSIQTPSTINRDELLSQVTREHSSLTLSVDTSSEESKSEGLSREPQTTTQTATPGGGRPNFGGLVRRRFCKYMLSVILIRKLFPEICAIIIIHTFLQMSNLNFLKCSIRNCHTLPTFLQIF